MIDVVLGARFSAREHLFGDQWNALIDEKDTNKNSTTLDTNTYWVRQSARIHLNFVITWGCHDVMT